MTERRRPEQIVAERGAPRPPRTISAPAGGAAAGIALTLVTGVLPQHTVIAGTELDVMSLTRFLGVIIVGIAVSVIDLREHRIPNAVLLPTAAGVVASALTEGLVVGTITAWRQPLAALDPITTVLLGGAAAFIVFFALAWFGTLGFGDVKLAALLGAALLGPFGWLSLVYAGVLAYILALPHALALLVRKVRHRGTNGDLAFGPYLVLGAIAGAAAAMMTR